MSRFQELYKRVVAWGNSKGIISAKNQLKQQDYSAKETFELWEHIVDDSNIEKIKDDIGDILVTQINAIECYFFNEQNALKSFLKHYEGDCSNRFMPEEGLKHYCTGLINIFTDSSLQDESTFFDGIITLNTIAKQSGLDILDCLEFALNEIEGRKGETINGVFYKNK